MNRYRNTRTGIVIDVPCEISGDEWERVETPAPKKSPAKKRTVKSDDKLRNDQ